MPVALALPLVAAGSAITATEAAALVVAIGSVAHLAQDYHFRRAGFPGVATGLEGEPTLLEKVQDMINGARIPVGSPEHHQPGGPTWGELAALLGAAGKVGQQIWHWLNRPRIPDTRLPVPGAAGGASVTVTTSPRFCEYDINATFIEVAWWPGWHPVASGVNSWNWSTTVSWGMIADGGAQIDWGTTSVNDGIPSQYVTFVMNGHLGDGTPTQIGTRQKLVKQGTVSVTITPKESNQAGWVTTTNLVPPPLREEELPARTPAAPPLAPPLVLPSPSPTPGPGDMELPDDLEEALGPDADRPIWEWPPEVGTGTDPRPVPPPGQAPAVAPPVPAVPIPGSTPIPEAAPGQPITGAGTLAPPAPQPPKVTDPDSHFVGGVEIPGTGANPSPVAIAAEVARIEQKVARLMRPAVPGPDVGDWLDNLANLIDLVSALTDLLQPDVPGRDWKITAPCNKDANGLPIVFEKGVPSASPLPAILERLDALMDAQTATTGWRKPTCKVGTPANVTITAIGIDPAPKHAPVQKTTDP